MMISGGILRPGAFLALIWLTCIVVGIVVYLEARDSLVFDNGKFSEIERVRQLVSTSSSASQAKTTRTAADKYWTCYPDVEKHPYFGRLSPLSHLGAREHFDRHGKLEGRIWPSPVTPCK